jgi:hypothetical protein
MAVSIERFASETGSGAAEYFDWRPEAAPFAIHMHRDAIDGITRDVIEGVKSLPRRGLEIGGLLLGHIIAGSVWIERYKRIDSNHRFGPQYILDDADRTVLESTAASILEAGELSVVGLYRSQTRPGFDIDEADRELIRRYFADPHDLVLLIRPESGLDMEARFFVRQTLPNGGESTIEALGEPFPFRGRGISLHAAGDETVNEAAVVSTSTEEPDTPDTRITHPPVAIDIPAPATPRRFIPDFLPDDVEPAHVHAGVDTAPPESGFGFSRLGRLARWWPMLAAAAVVLAGATFLILPGHRAPAPAPAAAQVNEPVRPLGLYVSPAGNIWRVTWNPNATALREARGVQLFVREGEDQNRIELTPRDLASGTYEYHPTANDVTFRLEATQSSGAITAESFRYDRIQPAAPTASAPSPVPAPAPAGKAVAPKAPVTPRAIHRVPPVVASSIRPRISGTIPIDVKVKVDRKGRVVSAVPVAKEKDGLHKYLAARAVIAARQWRFEPQPAEGEETIHFVFQK